MTTVLQQRLTIGPLASGATTTVDHALQIDDVPQVPSSVMPDRTTPIVVVGTPTRTQIMFRNAGDHATSAVFAAQVSTTRAIQVNSALIGADPMLRYWRGTTDVIGPQNNLTAVPPPTVNDDESSGFGTDSLWISTRANRGYRCHDPAAGAADWQPTSGAPRLLNVLDYGAIGNGVADDYAAIRAAYVAANGGRISLPAGTYRLSQTLILDGEGATIVGIKDETTGAGVTITTAAGVDAFRIATPWKCHIQSLFIDGQNQTQNGIVCYSAARCSVRDVHIKRCTANGILLDIDYLGLPTGNNNLLVLANLFISNCEYGIRVVESSDNNGIEFIGVECSNNTRCGILYKGVQSRWFGGHFQANGEYGIRISEPGDAGYSAANILFGTSFESNTLSDYYGGGKSARNLAIGDGGWDFANAAGSADLRLCVNTGAAGNLQVDDGNVRWRTLIGTASVAITADGTPADVSIYLRPKGAGVLYLDDQQTGGVSIGNGTAVKRLLSNSAVWDPANMAAGAVTSTTITVAGAAVGDPATASHDQIGANDVLISAHVSGANTVTVVLMNMTGAPLDIAAGVLRAMVWQY